MKYINVIADVCKCGCQYCEYNPDNVMFDAICPYKNCGAEDARDLEVNDGGIQIVTCSDCDKEFGCKVSFDYV